MSSLLGRLPIEIRALILEQLPSLGNVSLLSLVCRGWRIATFPYLHRTMHISQTTHLETLAERLTSTNIPELSSVSSYLRCLKFSGSVYEEDTDLIEYIAPRLPRLSSLVWELDFAPADFYCFSAHRELKSVQISNGFVSTGEDEVENWMDRLPELLVFTNLTHFLFKSEAMGNNDSYIEAMTSLLESSPSLESLILNIEDVGKSAWAYSLTPVLEALGDQFVLPRLRTLRILGDVETEWYRFADDTTYPLRAFLVRHPRIRNFGIGLSPDGELYDGIDPDLLAELLPSVQHLAFPMFLCESVVTSKLALQIETLAITNLYLYDDDPFGPTFEVLCEDSLPKLRTLEIWASGGCEYKLETEVVEAFLLAAKELEVLDFEIQVDDIDEFESLLSTTDNLCRKSTSR